MTKNRFGTIALLMVAFIIGVACGGGNNNGGNGGNGGNNGGGTKSAPQAAFSLIPGTHIFGKKTTTTTSFNWSLVQPAFAQSSSIVLSQSFNGACNLSPDGMTQNVSIVVYGLGQNSAPNCTNQWSFDSDGSGAAAGANNGMLVVGNGTISNLVAWSSTGTNAPTGAVVRVWVRRNGQALDTGVSCTIQGTGYQKCSSSAQYQALDGDFVVATIALPTNDLVRGLNVLFTKQ